MKYRIVVYRRTGTTMQQFNADTIEQALAIKRVHVGKQGVYKVEMLLRVEVWDIAPDGKVSHF